ncbi:MAG: hypothetical protein ACRDNS_34210, partial [Trebonia sp.]
MSTILKRAPALLLAAVALSAMIVATPAAARGGSALRPGVYDCESYAIGGLDYRESVKLLGGGAYQQAYDRHHAQMIKPTHGTYRIVDRRIVFHGGALAKTPGQIHARAHSSSFFAL